MSNIQKKLTLVSSPHPRASIISLTASPAFKGHDDEDLLCGNCSTILSNGVSEQTMSSRFSTLPQLLVKCPVCGAYNNFSTQKGN